jgi:hypothetical protein
MNETTHTLNPNRHLLASQMVSGGPVNDGLIFKKVFETELSLHLLDFL